MLYILHKTNELLLWLILQQILSLTLQTAFHSQASLFCLFIYFLIFFKRRKCSLTYCREPSMSRTLNSFIFKTCAGKLTALTLQISDTEKFLQMLNKIISSLKTSPFHLTFVFNAHFEALLL